jgi:hypothetical protein
MAEWSMAVVLKTTRIGYTKTVIFSRQTSPEHSQMWPNFARSRNLELTPVARMEFSLGDSHGAINR